MILLTTDSDSLPLFQRLSWDGSPTELVTGGESWSRASRRLIDDLKDEQGQRFPLRAELWISVYPVQMHGRWRAEADAVGPALVGRGKTAEGAVQDWRKRFRASVQRYLELRPFEMTAEDRTMGARIGSIVDVSQYKAMKPLVVRQIGKVVKSRPGLTVVQWEDGAREKVNPQAFDEVFSRFRIGQSFEALVTRNALTFRILRADAVRKLSPQVISKDRATAIWERAVGMQTPDSNGDVHTEQSEEQFWLQPPE